MTSLSVDNNEATYQIRAFKPGQIQINDIILTRSLIVTANQLIEGWPPQRIAEVTHEHLAQAAALQPDVLILGTGKTQEFIPIELYGDFLNQGIGVEIMDTAAACRTYNVLTAENRHVVAALVL